MTVSGPGSFIRVLKGIVDLALEFEAKTGLLIRAPIQAQAYRIGASDQYPMITRKVYAGLELEVPYVPGSSFKGRMRSLLELALGKKLYTTDRKIWQHVRNLSAMDLKDFVDDVVSRCVVDELFGYAAANYEQIKEEFEKSQKSGIQLKISVDEVFKNMTLTRLIVDDFFPTEEYVSKIGAKSIEDFLEDKYENRIDRVTSAADPRDVVRVKPGARFRGKVKLLVFDLDADYLKVYLSTIATGLKLIEATYLGSSGSRGYGRVKFVKIVVGASKVEVINGMYPKLETLKLDKAEYDSVEAFESAVENLAGSLKKDLFG